MPSQEEKKEVVNSTKGFSSSLFFHSILILIGISPLATFNAPIWEEEEPGMEVALGFPDEGQGNDEPTPGNNDPGGLPPPSASQSNQQPSSPPPSASASDPEPTKSRDEPMITNDAAEDVAIAAAKESRRKKAERDQVEAEQRRNAEVQAEANRRAEADRKAKEAADYAAAKGNYGGLLKGKGTGRGNTGKAGNQGDPNGDPNAKNLEGIHTGGKGRIGGGLGNRGVVSEPKIQDNSQATGRVIIKVCVNKSGTVTSAEYTQKGSTTNDGALISIAKRNAMKFRFTTGDVDQQCGTITYDFKLQ